MAEINWVEYDQRDHVLAWLLCEAINSQELREHVKQGNKFDGQHLDVKLTVNGIECDLLRAANYLQSQLESIENRGKAKGRSQVQNNALTGVEEMADECRRVVERHLSDMQRQLTEDQP